MRTVPERLTDLLLLCERAPVGLCLLDRELRFLRINHYLAQLGGRSVADHLGRTPAQVIGDISAQVEPTMRRAIHTGEPQLDIEIHGSTPNEPEVERTWVASFYPLKDEDDTVSFVSCVVQDVTELKIAQREKREIESQLEERLRFERLLANLSATFVSVPAEEVDQNIEKALRGVAGFLGVDRATLSQFSEEKSELQITHSWQARGIEPVPHISVTNLSSTGVAFVPQAEIFKFSRLEDLPVEAEAYREAFEKYGTKSHLSIPLTAGESFLGVLSLASVRSERSWPNELVERLRLVARTFANALTRKQADERLGSALVEIQKLRDQLSEENLYLREEIKGDHDFEELVGDSRALRDVLHKVEQVAATDSTVLLLGETGTGKELVARAIHSRSPRKDRPLIKVNCAALPATLIESELFGHEKGAFTGALAKKVGRFELANGGTIFLDEIGDLPLELQAKLLRVLQDGEYERLGSTETLNVDVRVIAATNRDLAAAVGEGEFRADLYYRLGVFPVELPPLRSRKEDIPLLVWHFLSKLPGKLGKKIEEVPQSVMDALVAYSWPGNVRELENVIERAVILSPGSTLRIEESLVGNGSALKPSHVNLEDVERAHIIDVLEESGWKVKGSGNAADRLGLNPSTLRYRMKRLGIERPTPQ